MNERKHDVMEQAVRPLFFSVGVAILLWVGGVDPVVACAAGVSLLGISLDDLAGARAVSRECLMPNLTPDQPAPVKRFIVFAHDDYYPLGGWEDFRGSFDTQDEAMADAKVAVSPSDADGHYHHDHAEIVDLATGQHTTIDREPDPPQGVVRSGFWDLPTWIVKP